MSSKHQTTITAINYPGSSYAERVVWKCSCGRKGTLRDGHAAPTRARAQAAAKRHVEAARGLTIAGA